MDIYVQKDGQQQGPFPEAKIRQGIDAGDFAPADLAWMQGKASWQPLSSLINLDTTKPPPFPSSLNVQPKTPSVPVHPVFVTPTLAPPLLSVTPQAIPAPVQGGGRTCKKCGASYKLWSPNRAMGSGLCVSCTPKPDNSSWDPYNDAPIASRENALKAVRTVGIIYLVLVGIDVVLGIITNDASLLVMAVILLICSLTMWLAHSRIAAVLLIIIITLGLSFQLLDQGIQNFTPWMIVTMIQIGLTIKGTKAVFMLNKTFKAASPADRTVAVSQNR